MNIDSDKLLEWISEYAHEFYCWGHDDADMALCVEVLDLRDAIQTGELDADRPEGNTAADSVAQMVSQSAEMNGEDAFWRHMLRLPVAKFIGPMRKALRNYETQSADRPECEKCNDTGKVISIEYAGDMTRPKADTITSKTCNCKASK